MTTEYGNVLGIQWLKHSSGEPNFALCLISFEVDSTVTSGDTVKLGDATHGTRLGVVTKETLVAMLQDDRRDGQTVTLGTGTASDGLMLLAEPGNDGVIDWYFKSAATSDTGANITMVFCDSTGTNQSTASGGMTLKPMTVCISVTLSATVGT